MKVAAATILSLVATAAYASPTAYSETQEVGTHDSTTESSADSYLEKRGGGFYGNYAQGAGGVHHAPPNHWNHGSHKTGGHHQYPQTPNPSRLYGSNQPRHRTPPRDLGPYEKLRHDQQQQQQQQQQQHHHHQQQYQQQYHHQHHHHQQHQHHHQHHQQQHHQQKSALQQYQEQRRRQHQQHHNNSSNNDCTNINYNCNTDSNNDINDRKTTVHIISMERTANIITNHNIGGAENAQPVEGGNNGAEVDVETEETVEFKPESGTNDGEPDTINDQPKDEDKSNGPEVKPEDDNNFESELSGSNVVTTGDESEDQVTGPEYGTKAGDDDEFKPEVEGETNEPGDKRFSLGKMWGTVKKVLKKKSHSTHSQEHDQDMAKTPEQSTDEDTGPEDSTRTEENGEVGESGTKDGDFDTKDDQPEGGNGGPEVQLEDDNNFESELSGSNVVTTGDESEDQVTEPEYGTETEETVEFKPESGADGGDFDTENNNPEGGNGGPEVQLEDDNNFESELSGSNVVTTGDESEDQVTEPEYGTETEETVEFKPESGADGGESGTKDDQPEGGNGGPEVKPEDDDNFGSELSGSNVVTTGDESEDQVTEPETNTKTGNDDEVELGGGAYDSDFDTGNNQPKDEDESNGPEVKPEDDDNFGSELSGSNVVTTGEESEDKSTEPETNTKTGDDDEVKPEVEGETNEPEAKKPSFGKMLKSSFQRIFGFKSPSPHPQEHDQDMAKTPEQSTDEDTGPEDSTRTEETVEFKPESGADGGDFDNKNNNPEGGNGGPEVQLEDDNNFESELSGSNVVTTGDESEDQVTEPEYGTETEETVEFKPESGADGGESGTEDDEPKDEDESNGPEVQLEDDNNFESELSGSNVVTTGDESEDQVTEPEYGTETGDDDEVELGGGAYDSDFDTKDDEPKDEDESNGPEVKPENDNNFESGSSGSDVVTTGDESTDEGTGPEKNTESEDDNEVEESGTKDSEYDTENNQLQREGDKPEGEPENDNNPKSGPSGSDAVTASGESEDQVTEPETNTKTGDDDEVELGGETNKPGAKKFSFGKMLKSSFQQVFKKKPHTSHTQEHDQDTAKTPEQSTDEDTGPEDSTKSGETVEFKPESGADGGESGTEDDEPKDEDESNGPEVKPEDDNNFGSGPSGSNAETANDESGDESTVLEYGTETGESGEIKLESGTYGSDFDTKDDDESSGPEVQPENDNNPTSGTSGSDAETASGESGDKSTKPADGTEARGSGEVKPKVETTQSKTKRPPLSRSMAESIRESLNKPFPIPKSRKNKQDMTKASKKSKVKITGPKYDSGTEESDDSDSDSDSEGEYVFGGYDESENENNKPENDNNPKSGTSGSDAETAGEKSGDKVTGSGDDTGAGDDDEVKLEGGAKGGESKAEDEKLEDGAAKPENDRVRAPGLPWDSFMQERRSKKTQQSADYWVTALDPGVENVYTWLRGGVINGRSRSGPVWWLDGTVEHESMGTRHDNRALAARLADFLQVAYQQYQSTLWKYHRDRIVEVG
ncbi:hypothetical protein BASA81_017175 [Batrachochytrium salamandrivorans]|nr:hypothetical protein BASA81_017175 [Batrachochytrium salamandrivorans]